MLRLPHVLEGHEGDKALPTKLSNFFVLEMVDYGLKCPRTVCARSERTSRSQERPLSFLQGHGGDKALPDKL